MMDDFSLREGRILDVFVDCEWSRTEVLLAHSLDVPDDCDIIVGYLFTVSLLKGGIDCWIFGGQFCHFW